MIIIQYGSVPLMIAARMGHIKTVQRLLELGADVNCKEKVSYLVEGCVFWTKFGIKTTGWQNP